VITIGITFYRTPEASLLGHFADLQLHGSPTA